MTKIYFPIKKNVIGQRKIKEENSLRKVYNNLKELCEGVVDAFEIDLNNTLKLNFFNERYDLIVNDAQLMDSIDYNLTIYCKISEFNFKNQALKATLNKTLFSNFKKFSINNKSNNKSRNSYIKMSLSDYSLSKNKLNFSQTNHSKIRIHKQKKFIKENNDEEIKEKSKLDLVIEKIKNNSKLYSFPAHFPKGEEKDETLCKKFNFFNFPMNTMTNFKRKNRPIRLLKLENEKLNNCFKNEKIKYKISENGSFRFYGKDSTSLPKVNKIQYKNLALNNTEIPKNNQFSVIKEASKSASEEKSLINNTLDTKKQSELLITNNYNLNSKNSLISNSSANQINFKITSLKRGQLKIKTNNDYFKKAENFQNVNLYNFLNKNKKEHPIKLTNINKSNSIKSTTMKNNTLYIDEGTITEDTFKNSY